MKRALLCLVLSAACAPDLGGEDAQALVSGSAIRHLVVIVQENHSFVSYFGTWCRAPAGSAPTCTAGANCCEGAPATDPGTGRAPIQLTDFENGDYSPDHTQACELAEMLGGSMAGFVDASCGDHRNFAIAGPAVAQYHAWADRYAIADRYFQPVVGASSSNDMYFATARFMFTDNTYMPKAIGHGCAYNRNTIQYDQATIADLLSARGVDSVWYAEGYKAMVDSWLCPLPPDACTSNLYFPCTYDPSDIPVAYFANTADNPDSMRDYQQLAKDIAAGALPAVSFVKPLGYRSEHPGTDNTIQNGVDFVSRTVAAVESSRYASSTLVLVTWDESGGFFDHVKPPPAGAADKQPYGPRVPLLALGPFARRGTVSHVTMEHSSIVKFIEWNWLGKTGQLKARDAEVNNIGSLLDPAATGVAVPTH